MILIQRGKEPDSLLQYRKSSAEACYEEMPGKSREEVRKQLWEEQCGLCAYCMRKIDSPQKVRIEHYSARHPQGEEYSASASLDYKNMLGVCYGNSLQPGVKYEDTTCDAHRRNTSLTVNPYNIHSIRKIRYTTDGFITSEDAQIKKDVDITLNLNCQASSLPDIRKTVLLQTKREIQKSCGNKEHDVYLAFLKRLYERYTKQRRLMPYCGITIAWMEKELGIE